MLTVPVEDFKEKPIVTLAKRAATGVGLGKVLTQLDEKLETGSAAEKEEAETLKQKLIAYADRLKQVAEESRDSAPHRRLDILKQLAKEFRNHPIGEEADAAFRSIKTDDGAMNARELELRARLGID